MLSFLKSYAVTFIVFILIELLWLLVIARDLYAEEIGYIMRDEPNLVPAGFFSILFAFGLVFFVVHPALDQGTWTSVLISGILYGLITYATYTLTNFANLEGWPIRVTLIDLLWGMVLGGTASTISFLILNRIK